MKFYVSAMAALALCLTFAACQRKEGDAGASKQDGKKQAGPSGDAGKDGKGKASDQGAGTVTIEPSSQKRAGIVIAGVEVRTMPQLLTLPGQVETDERHTSHVGALADGRVAAVYVLPGAVVRRGTLLAQIHSHTVHETVGSLVQAYAAVDRQRSALAFAQQAVDRYGHLYSIQAASLEDKQHSEQMLAQARQDLLDAQANVHMEREHLSELLQVPPESLTPNNLYDKELVPIRSPIDGVVLTRNITVGQVVDTGFEAFVVSNLATVWVTAALNEKDLSLVHTGAMADVVTQGYPDLAFPARVAMVGDTLDPQTRTVPVRIVVANPATRLRPGMFASAHIAGERTRTAVFAPEDALQDINGIQVVFVAVDGKTFRSQAVKTGTRSQGRAEIVEGLKPGDRIVVDGAFMLKSELLKSTMGEG